jgi:ligand-binding SRPBCC domain-containing protein
MAHGRDARFEISSTLGAPRTEVWTHAGSMAGVNAELAPWIRMTYPPEAATLEGVEVPLGQPLFRSLLLLFGVLPVDLHTLILERVEPLVGFGEASHSLLQRRWIHRRQIEPADGGCRITDRIEYETRLPLLGVALAPFIRFLFRQRHRYLRQRFGGSPIR